MIGPQAATSEKLFHYGDAEIVLGIVAAIGVNYGAVQEWLSKELAVYGYTPNVFRVSEVISETAKALDIVPPADNLPEGSRITAFMNAGNAIRKASGHTDIFALLAAAQIATTRTAAEDGRLRPFSKVAHIIVSLKRPEEVEPLRQIYGCGFYLIGLFAGEQERLDYLIHQKDISKGKASQLIQRDMEDEDKEFGQRTRDTFHLADVFTQLKNRSFEVELKRFLNLIFGHPYTTPAPDEFAMFHAYAASLRSAQLGRQVGAAIVNARSDLISVGCNEVPSPGGGLYWEGSVPDNRDHTRKEDSNDLQKSLIIDDIVARLRAKRIIGREGSITQKMAEEAIRSSLLKEITEFGRAVHAEMDALLACARNSVSPVDATLFTTTFPCHNCTRHIIAAGIKRVVYIEPYPKSQAAALHEDAIRIEDAVIADVTATGNSPKIIPFSPFIGVGPRRFFDLFSVSLSSGFHLERKRNGKVFEWDPFKDARPRVPLAPTSYLDRELIAAKRVYSIFGPKPGAKHAKRKTKPAPARG